MIKIICVGKLKEKYWREALAEYEKRLSKYTKLEIIEVADVAGNESYTLAQEKEKIERYISDRDFIIALAIEGKQMSSLYFAEHIEKVFLSNPCITFVIGGSVGLHDSLKERAHYLLSFSTMTFPHQLFRILLLEQIYRAYKISNHESYHK